MGEYSNAMKPIPKTINIVLMDGGVGDHIASLVAINYLLKNYPWITPYCWMPDYLVSFAKNVLPKDTFVRGNSKLIDAKYDPYLPTKTTKWDGVVSPMKIHLLDYAFLKICDENPSIEHKNYLQVNFDKLPKIKDLPDKFVVMTTGFTAEVREFKAKTVNEVCKYIIDKGYTPLFLGQTQTKTGAAHTIQGNFNEEIDFSCGVNLIDKTTLLQTAQIMSQSAAVVGVDNGLLHVAGCTQTPILGGFTTVSPKIRMPVRHNTLGWNYYTVTPNPTLSCKFCQQKTNFLYGHDYKSCWYKQNKESIVIECVEQMTANKFIEHLEKIL